MYYDNRDEAERFIERVAEEVLGEMKQEDKDSMALHPDPFLYHFGLGLYIRNKYIHGQELGFSCFDPDDLSSDIIERIINKLK